MASRSFGRARGAARLLWEPSLWEGNASIQWSIPLAGVLLLLACAEGGVDSGDALDAAPLRPAAEELRIGSVDDPDLGFSTIAGVAVDDEGRVFVLDAQEREVRAYDSAGILLHRFGSEGEGPGEFRTSNAIGVLGDTVWVADALAGRITLFDPTGSVLATRTPGTPQIESSTGSLLLYRPQRLMPGGRIQATSMGVGGERDGLNAVPELVIDAEGTVLDTLWVETYSQSDSDTRITVGSVELPIPSLQDDSDMYVAGGEFGHYVIERPVAASAERGTFRVLRIGPEGDTTFHRSFPYEPVPYSDPRERIEELAGDLTAMLGSMVDVDRDRVAQTLRSSVEVPEYHVPVSAAHRAEDGSLWLRRERTAAPAHEWLLLDPDGTLRGRTELPAGAMVRSADGDVLWAAVSDELGVPWLVRYRLEG